MCICLCIVGLFFIIHEQYNGKSRNSDFAIVMIMIVIIWTLEH